MRSEAECQQRLREAVVARRELMAEEKKAEKNKDTQAMEELAEEIANLSGVIFTLEWVLQSGAAPEYE
ncbi:MAG: hypothetical protein JWP00_158 [Chloroflexi bacterium]|jgi:hypothetical protein|nr:hypothetical protein [Chloroflexota bacterium]